MPKYVVIFSYDGLAYNEASSGSCLAFSLRERLYWLLAHETLDGLIRVVEQDNEEQLRIYK